MLVFSNRELLFICPLEYKNLHSKSLSRENATVPALCSCPRQAFNKCVY